MLGEIGPILTALWISHVGSYGNRPRWMAFGLVTIAVGMLLAFSMVWIFPPPQPLQSYEELEPHTSERNTSGGTDQFLCRDYMAPTSADQALIDNNCTTTSTRRRWAFAAWILIYSLLGQLPLSTSIFFCLQEFNLINN